MNEERRNYCERLALQIAAQLPENAKERRLVLDLIHRIADEFLGKTGNGPARHP
jgi:hypothetical protein